MKYTKKPVTIEAIQFNGNFDELEKFVGGDAEFRNGKLLIATLEGPMTASDGDWIIKGIKGEFYPCKPDIFELTYEPEKINIETRRIDRLTFSEALDYLKNGQALQRDGWNGKGMYVVCQKGYPDGIAINKNTAEATKQPEGTVCVFRPYLMLRSVDGSFVPWVPSISDVLADDWQCLPQTA